MKGVDGFVGGGGDVAPLDVDGVGHVVIHRELAGTKESSSNFKLKLKFKLSSVHSHNSLGLM